MARELLSESSSDSEIESGGAALTVNAEYAKRFEHNKKREELQKLEDKHGKSSSRKRKRGHEQANDVSESASETSSSSEDEDSEGEFATAELDHEIFATLNAIKNKDPRVYDKGTTFYTDFDETAATTERQKKDKPMYLQDYQRETLLQNAHDISPDEEEEVPVSYNTQQEVLRRTVTSAMHAATAGSDTNSDSDDGDFLVRKEKPNKIAKNEKVVLDVENADKDPETFLSNFMTARAWVPTDRSAQHAFESDDEEEDERAEKFEEAYNLRFEDPTKSNEVLRTYGREAASKYSVRRDEANPRQKKREAEKAARAAAKEEERAEKRRLKKLRMEAIEEKIQRIRRAAGLKTQDLQPGDWQRFIDDEWDDARWEEEMQKRFNDNYYAEQDQVSSDEQEGLADGVAVQNKKPKKPKFDEDIDIKDIVPDFVSDEEAPSLTDEENDRDETAAIQEPPKSLKQLKQEKQAERRKERRIIEQLVEDQLQMDIEHALPASSRAKAAGFRYRETSPNSFGLTHRDILLADDAALNSFAGLKKLGAFRDPEKKKKDKKHLGKKARLRKWRLDTFGDEEGVEGKELVPSLRVSAKVDDKSDVEDGGVDIREGGKKKSRRRKKTKTGREMASE